jgi:hypothetical protein
MCRFTAHLVYFGDYELMTLMIARFTLQGMILTFLMTLVNHWLSYSFVSFLFTSPGLSQLDLLSLFQPQTFPFVLDHTLI